MTQPNRITIDAINNAVAKSFAINVSDLIEPRQLKVFAQPRHIAMYLARLETQASFPAIGRAVGNRDHTTVMFACAKVDHLQAHDAKLAARIAAIRAQLKITPANAVR